MHAKMKRVCFLELKFNAPGLQGGISRLPDIDSDWRSSRRESRRYDSNPRGRTTPLSRAPGGTRPIVSARSRRHAAGTKSRISDGPAIDLEEFRGLLRPAITTGRCQETSMAHRVSVGCVSKHITNIGYIAKRVLNTTACTCLARARRECVARVQSCMKR